MATNASGKTPYLGLSQWSAEDYILHDDFNADNMLIDEALAAGCKVAHGSYVGTGTYGVDNKSMLIFDFEPKFVFIQHSRGSYLTSSDYIRSMACVYGAERGAKMDGNYFTYLTWDGNMLSWYADTGYNEYTKSGEQLNFADSTYLYFAIG